MSSSSILSPDARLLLTAPLHLSLSRPLKFFSGVRSYGDKDKQGNLALCARCSVVSNPLSQEVLQGGLTNINWHEVVKDDFERGASQVTDAEHDIYYQPSGKKQIIKVVDAIKSMLSSINDGEITISAYDTAWVALVENVNGSKEPQFPSALRWIADNQLSDGSWGDKLIYTAFDRIINTLACVVALKSWNIHTDKCDRGISFLRENISKLEHENPEHMPIGFEVAFPSLLEIAKSLDIQIPYDAPFLQEIYACRDIKLKRIPKHVMHRMPTTLLHSLEGMPGLDWKKLLKLQSQDGSFLFSPSSTAYALKQTRNENCLRYLQNIVERFNGGVPNVYPVDLFEHIWIVDRLERLGISRYFQPEINQCVSYVFRYWNESGICWARNSEVVDIDDTAMGFRLLRSHGHKVSADVFQHFKKGEEFICFAGQSTQAVTGMYNLLRASQLKYPGDKILEEAKEFSSKFLKEKQTSNELCDKWIIMKDLAGEVGYTLEVPWYANLPRLETRFYIEQYGGANDVWIGKTLYRMPYVNNNIYLELAKLDYNNCQALHRIEWDYIQKWYEACGLWRFGTSRSTLLLSYFLAAANLFEPEKSRERIGWTKTATLLETITSYFDNYGVSPEERTNFLNDFTTYSGLINYVNGRQPNAVQDLVAALVGVLSHLSLDTLMAHGQDIRPSLSNAWEKWLVGWTAEGDKHQGEAEILVQTILLTSGYSVSDELLGNPQYQRLSSITNKVCFQLRQYYNLKVQDPGDADTITIQKIDLGMQELIQEVLDTSADDIDLDIKQTFLTVAKSFYYKAYFDSDTISKHIINVLFTRAE